MDINRLTEKVQEGISSAQSKAIEHGNQHVDVEHLLLALIEQEKGLATSILNKANADTGVLRERLEREIDRIPKVSGAGGALEQVYITPRLNRVLTQAEVESKTLGDAYVSVEHVLLAMTDDRPA
jgi:ATP-dependent Clp protease ATP-binding subunit ClpB